MGRDPYGEEKEKKHNEQEENINTKAHKCINVYMVERGFKKMESIIICKYFCFLIFFPKVR